MRGSASSPSLRARWRSCRSRLRSAQVPREDSVAGRGFLSVGVGQGTCQFEIDAECGPSSEHPTGHPPLHVPSWPARRRGHGSERAGQRCVDDGCPTRQRKRRPVQDLGQRPWRIGRRLGQLRSGLPEPQPVYFNLGFSSGDFVVVYAPPLPDATEQFRTAAGKPSACSRTRAIAGASWVLEERTHRSVRDARTVTAASPQLHPAVTAPRERGRTLAPMGTTWRVPAAITGRLLFVTAVTCYLLAWILSGGQTPVETVVYGATAALGLEFVLASWRELWRRG